ncbi:flavin reductase family protein [Actinoplanes sp. NPDC049118]|uniref:flavin reductase family protein n=1 Tax=Actinoplanes sp. NPDC049118 TaxID=3155769 RepID=UPI0033C47328
MRALPETIAPPRAPVAGGEALGAEPGVDTPACLSLYRRLSAGVTVVTSRHRHTPVGMTASAVTSLSLRPPLLLACLASTSRTLAGIRLQRTFAVHLLREEQVGWAESFARTGHEGFGDLRVREVLGTPVLVDALAWTVCLLVEAREYGDHHTVVGEVVATHSGAGRPLLWHDRSYWGLRPAGQ